MATDQHDTVTAALPTPAAGPQMRMLAVASIVASSTNPRKTFDQAKLQELADSIKASGVHQPILVRPLPTSRLEETSRALRSNVMAWPFATTRKREPIDYELVAGERRWRACQLAGVAEIPVMIRELTDDQVLEIQIVENLQRVDVAALEEAEGINALITHSHLSAKEVAKRIGRSVRYVYQRLQLLNLCQEAAEALRTGSIDPSKAREISYIPDPKLQQKALAFALEKEWNQEPKHSTRELEQFVRTNIMLRMDRARFDTASEKLVPVAGSCTTCPKRTGANPDLFGDNDGPDLCTDQPCYRAKEAAHDQAAVDKAKKAGHKVITAEEARGLVESSPHVQNPSFKGYTLLDESAYSIGVIGSTVRKALGDDCPEPTIIIHPLTGKSVAAVKTSTAKRLISEKRQAAAAKAADKAEAEKVALPVEKRPEYRSAWLHASADAVAAKFQGPGVAVPPEALRVFLIDAAGYEDEGPIGEALGLPTEFDWSEMENRLHTIGAAELPGVFTRWLLFRAMSNVHSSYDVLGDSTHMLPLLAGVAGVDVRQVQADVKRKMESEDRAKALEEAEKRKKPAAATDLAAQAGEGAEGGKGGKGAAKKSAARAGAKAAAEAPKTSKAKASADIAAAMQALEGESTTGSAAALQGDKAPAPAGAAPVDKAQPKLKAGATAKAQDVAPTAQGNEAQPVAAAQATPQPAGAPAAPLPEIDKGTLVRIKDDARGPNGKRLKTCGRVCWVAKGGTKDLVLHYGPKSSETVLSITSAEVEPYKADPLIGSKVRVLSNPMAMDRNEYRWRQGTVKACKPDGWEIMFPGLKGGVATFMIFGTEELEVLE